jgi:MFS family permease
MSEAEISSTTQVQPEKQKILLGSIISMAFALLVDNSEGTLVHSLFPVIRDALNLNFANLGTLQMVKRFTGMFFGTFWAMIADRYGRKKVLVFVTGIWGIWTALAGLAQNYTQLVILYALGAIGTCACEPAAFAILSDMFTSSERGKAYGILRTIVSIGIVIFTPLIGQLSKVEAGWRYGLFAMGGLSVLSGILMALFIKEPEQGASEPLLSVESSLGSRFELAKLKIFLKNRTYILMLVSSVLWTSAILFAYAVTYLVDVRGFHNATATIIYAVAALGFGISSYLGGIISDSFDRRNPDKGRIIFMQLTLVAYSVMSILAMHVAWKQDFMYYIIWFIWGLIGSFGATGAEIPMTTTISLPEMRSTAFSLRGLITGGIKALIALLAGFTADRYGLPTTMILFITIPYTVNAVFWFTMYKAYPQDVANVQQTLAERAAASSSG